MRLATMNMARVLMSHVRVARPLAERLLESNNSRIISFVGPTGVGKTTTLAKIAAEIVLQNNV